MVVPGPSLGIKPSRNGHGLQERGFPAAILPDKACDRSVKFQSLQALRLVRGYKKPSWGYFLRAESFYNVATREEEYADFLHPSEKYHEKSHGESFLAVAQKYLTPGGLYFLDEPEAALSPQRQLTLLMEIFQCARQGAQFFMVSHSPILLGLPGARILSFDDGEVHPCAYEETESYQVMEMFINSRELLLKKLLKDL